MKKRQLFTGMLLTIGLFCLAGCGSEVDTKTDMDSTEMETTTEDVGTEGLKYTLQDDGTVWVSQGTTGNLSSIVIPRTYEGKTVSGIARDAFNNCTKLVSITIPDTVTTIGGSAFRYCDSLTSIEISNSVTSIGGYAFEEDYHLVSINIPYGVTTIEADTFWNCSILKSVVIPNSVTSIEGEAFKNCGFTSIEIPSSVTSIGGCAFEWCSKLTSITIPSSVTEIGYEAFRDCRSLTSVVFENPVGWVYLKWNALTSSYDNFPITVTDASQNVTYLTSTYMTHNWKRVE